MALLTSSWIADLFTLILLLISAAYLYMTRNFNYWKIRGVPFEKPIPLFGNMKQMVTFQISPGEFLRNMYFKTKKDFYGLFVFDKPYLIIRNPELIKSLMVKDFQIFNNRVIGDNIEDDPVGTYSLFTMKNPEWKAMRSKLTPMFSSGKIKSIFQSVHRPGEDLVKYLENDIVKRDSAEVKEICSKFTTDIIANCVFGLHSNCTNDEDNLFRRAERKMLTFTWSRAIQFFCFFFAPDLVKPFHFKLINPEGSDILRKICNDGIKQRVETGIKRKNIIDLLLELQREDSTFNGDKLVAQTVIFMTAGLDGPSSTIAFSLYELCKNMTIQDKLRKEIRAVLSKHNGEITYDCLLEMTYLHMVISETLRKYPSLTFIDRRAAEDYKLPGHDIIIDKGTPVCVPLLGLHYDPEYFPDPHKYDPERFSDENKHKIIRGTYLPFGIGPHKCIGERFGLLQVKFGLITIINRFKVLQNKNTPSIVDFDPKGFLATPKQGLHMTFQTADSPVLPA